MARAGIRASAGATAALLLLASLPARATTPAATVMPTPAGSTPGAPPSPASALIVAPAPDAPTSAEIPTTPRAQPPVYAPHEDYVTPRPGPQTSTGGPAPTQERRWRIRQAPLAGAEASWGAPGNQMPEYVEVNAEPPTPDKGPPPRGMGRIVSGAILGPAGLGLTIAGIVGATTSWLGDRKRLSVPMIGVGLVSSALGWALFADGIFRRRAFLRWQSKAGTVALAPAFAPGRFAGLTLVGRF